MAEIRLTTTQNIVKSTPMGGNVGTDNYIFLIDDVQIMVLEPILGTKLYNVIKEDYNNNTISGIYLQLLEDYIQPFLNHAVFAEYVRNGSFRIRNNGNLKISPNNSQTMTEKEDTSFVSHQMNKAKEYLGRLERFLDYKGSEIPEYLVQDNNYDIEPRDDNNYGITWHL